MNIIGIGNPEFAYKTLSKMGYRIFYIVSRNQYEKKKFTVGDLRNTNICDTNQCQYNLWDNWLVHKTV